jgi:hypothetical protein
MAVFSGISSLFWPRIDRRSAREIEDDIRDELRFHVDEATDALVASGLALEVARERAVQSFGNIERVRGACRRVQLGDRIMLQRIQWVVIAVLLLALVALGFQSVNMHRREVAAREMALAQLQEAEAARAFLTASLSEAQAGRATAEEVVKRASESVEQNPRQTVLSDLAREALDKTALLANWLKRLRADPDDWREAIAVGDEIASQLDAAAALEALQTLYPEMSIEQRQQIFKPFVFDGGHPMAVQILKLGAFDAEPSVRERAWQYLREYAFVDFSEHPAGVRVFDPSSASAWYARVGDEPLDRIFEDGAKELVAGLSRTAVDSEAFAKQARLLMSLSFEAARKHDPAFGSQLQHAGLLTQIHSWSASDSEDVRGFALRAASWLGLDADRLRSEVLLPMERNPVPATAAVWAEYCNLVGQRGNTWATPLLLERYRSVLASGGHGGDLFAPATALAKIGDVSVIPQLIALLATDDTPANRYAIGYFALRELTGVAWDESHGAQWWNDWWTTNSRDVETRAKRYDALQRIK